MAKNKKGAKKNKQGMKAKPAELSANSLVCTVGHLMALDIWGRLGTDMYTTRLSYEILMTTDSAGKFIVTLSNLPSGFANWANYVNVFDEYRVLGAHVMIKPSRFNGQLVTQAPVVTLIDYDSSANVTSYGQAGQYASSQETPGGVKLSRWFVMSGAENAAFVTTSAPVASWYIKFFSTGNTVSMDLGRVRVDFFVQFRGLGI